MFVGVAARSHLRCYESYRDSKVDNPLIVCPIATVLGESFAVIQSPLLSSLFRLRSFSPRSRNIDTEKNGNAKVDSHETRFKQSEGVDFFSSIDVFPATGKEKNVDEARPFSVNLDHGLTRSFTRFAPFSRLITHRPRQSQPRHPRHLPAARAPSSSRSTLPES